MFKILPVLLCALFIQAFAQEHRNYKESYALLDNTLYIGAQLYNACKRHGYEIVKIDVDLVGAGTENSKGVLKNLSSDFNYTICCIGERTRIKSIELKVLRLKDEVLVGQDTVQVVLKNPVTGNYMIEISAVMQAGFENEMGYFYLTIAHD